MKRRIASLTMLVLLLASTLMLAFTVDQVYAEPNLISVLNTLGFTNIEASTVETFPAGIYNVTLYAEFAAYHASNELSWYYLGTSGYSLIFSGPEGNFGYITPPLWESFTADGEIGLSFRSPEARYFTETAKNPDLIIHSMTFINRDKPSMILIGFENRLGGGDKDYQDMIISLELVTPRYYLNVQTAPPDLATIEGEGWYNLCTYVSLQAPQHIFVSSNSRYRFDHWDVDTTAVSGNPITVHMDDFHTATAHYIQQYYLDLVSPYDTPSGMGWYDADTLVQAKLATGVQDLTPGTRAVFVQWAKDATGTELTSNPIDMDAAKTAEAQWKIQHYLTVKTDPNDIADIPGQNWYYECTYVDLTAPEHVDVAEGTRYRFDHWDVDGSPVAGNPITVHMDAPHDATAHYVLQYYLTVKTSPEGVLTAPLGGGWHDKCTMVDLAASPTGYLNSEKYVFVYWDVDGSQTSDNPIKVHMDMPHVATAYYWPACPRHLDAEPPRLVNLAEPEGTLWHELYPEYCNSYRIEGWHDTNHNGGLDPHDYVGLWDTDRQWKVPCWWHVDDVTITLIVKKQGSAENQYIEFEGGWTGCERILAEPRGSLWHEVHPDYSKRYRLEEWFDNCDYRLTTCDWIILRNRDTGEAAQYHVEAVKTDLVISPRATEIRPQKLKENIGEGYPQLVPVIIDSYYTDTTTFKIEAYYDGSPIGSGEFAVNPLESVDAVIVWGETATWPKGVYSFDITINVYIDSVLVYTITFPATFKITIVGDVSGDGKVDLVDIYALSIAFGSHLGDVKHDPDCDINNDLKVDLKDFFIAARNYGKVDP